MANLSLPTFKQLALKGNSALTDSDVVNLYKDNESKLAELDPMAQMKAAMEIGAAAKKGIELPQVNVSGKRDNSFKAEDFPVPERVALDPVDLGPEPKVDVPVATVKAPAKTYDDTDTTPQDANLRVPVKTQLNNQLRDPYADTSQFAKNPNNPGASGLSQFDPDQLNAANADYARRIAAAQDGRFAAGLGSAIAGDTATANNNAYYKDLYGMAKDLSLGQQGRLQEQATAGSALATSMQNRDIASGKYTTEQTSAQIKQASDRADLTTKELTVAQQQRLNNSDSVETAMAKEIARAHLSLVVEPDKKAALLKIIDQPGITAQQLLYATGTLAPEAQKALASAMGVKEKEAGIVKTGKEGDLIDSNTDLNRAKLPGEAAESRGKQAAAMDLTGGYKPDYGLNPQPKGAPAAWKQPTPDTVAPESTQPANPRADLVAEGKRLQEQLAGESNPAIRKGITDRQSAITSELKALDNTASSLPVGTNNVGNLKDPKTGKFRTFESPAAGHEALMADLHGKIKGGHDTITTMITRYAPPSDNNPTDQYIANVSKATGIDPNAKLTSKDLPGIAAAIIKQEGNKKIVQPGAAAGDAPITGLTGGKDYNKTISLGGIIMTPSAAVTGQQAEAAKTLGEGRKLSQIATQYDIDGKTAALAKKSMDALAAGKFPATQPMGAILANLNIGESNQMKTQITDMVDAKNAYRVASGMDPLDRDTEVKRILTRPANLFQQEVLQFNEQVLRQSERQRQLEKHVGQTGSATGYNDNKVQSMTFMVNPKTGETSLASPNQIDKARKAGFVPPLELYKGIK